jgi:hypothetical protein
MGSSRKRGERPTTIWPSRGAEGRRLKMAERRKANRRKGSSIDGFLKEEGVLEEFQAREVKEVIAWQLAQAM